jgi:ABC-2 type transport system ATP-binding protein
MENEVVALKEVDLTIREGELFGLLGPNGAGKTTLIKILCTLLLPTSGRAYVDGIEVTEEPDEVRKRINMVSGGEHSGYGILNVTETLWLFSQFYGIPPKVARRRIEEMLEVFEMTEFAKTKINRLSTGMRQKMNVARGFISDPKILFLDEPTLGLDVHISRQVRDYIRRWVDEHPEKTVLLTTHYMAEAEMLCDRLAIIDRGEVLVLDTPANLKKSLEEEVVYHLEVDLVTNHQERFEDIQGIKSFACEHRADLGTSSLKLILESDMAIVGVTDLLESLNLKIRSLSRREPTLEEVFISLVGRGIENDED